MEADEGSVRNLCSVPVLRTHAFRSLIAFQILNAITATLGNAVILAALYKESSLHPPSKVLLRSLALTDLFVGILLEPLFVTFLMSKEYKFWDLCYRINAIAIFIDQVSCLVSLLALTAISVDRLLALSLGMRYRQVVTFERVRLIVICFWIPNIGFAAVVFWSKRVMLYFILIVVLLCLIVTTCCYIKIYQKLRNHQAQIEQQAHQVPPNGHEPLNIARYRKTVSSALWIQFSLLACYLPFGIITASMAFKGMIPSLLVAWTLSATLMFFNSTLNPILYCWKIREVRRAAMETLRQMCYLSN